jgi:hypothetical protein
LANGWSNINSWDVFKQTGIGALSGTIAGLGAGIGTTVLFGGLSEVVSGSLNGEISSFEDVMLLFTIGAVISSVTYGIGKIATSKMTSSKLIRIIGTTNNKSIINKRLANAGYSNLKIGKLGLEGVKKGLYKALNYKALESLVSDVSSVIISFIRGII